MAELVAIRDGIPHLFGCEIGTFRDVRKSNEAGTPSLFRPMKFTFAACALLLSSSNCWAITTYEVSYQKGVLAGMNLAADYVDNSAPDWTTDFNVKSDAEFHLVAMEQSYTLGTLGRAADNSTYQAGLADGIQSYIDLMNAVGEPVWFTGPSVTVTVQPAATRIARAERPAIGPFKRPSR